MDKTYSLEEAGYAVATLRQARHTEAVFTHQRDKDGRPTGRFIVDAGPQTDVPLRVLRSHQGGILK